MALPKAVRKQVEQAERDHAAAYSEAPAAPQGDASVVALQTARQADAEVQTPPELQEGFAREGEPFDQQGQQSDEAQPPGQQSDAAPPQGDDENGETWAQRYRSLKGMYDSQMPRLQRENQRLKDQVAGIEQVLAAMQKSAPQAAPGAAPQPGETPQQAAHRLRQEDVDAYGEDMIKVIRDAAYDEILPEIRKRDAMLEELRAQLGGVTKRTAQSESQRIESYLDANVPGEWRTINSSPEFLSWLEGLDMGSGRARQELLNEAGTAGDAARVAYFFNAFLNESQAISRRAPAQAPAPQTSGRQPKVDVSSLVTPGRPRQGGAGGAVDSEEPQVVTQTEIAQFYRDVQRGKYANKPAEKEAMEKQIFAAVQKGLVA